VYISTEELSALQDRLETVCHGMINLMREEARDILRSYSDCKSRSDSRHWHDRAAYMIVELAEALPPKISGMAVRAYCPLCGDGAAILYEEGFKLPEGLRRHLVGWGARHNQCSVFNAATGLARAYWKVKFQREDEAAAAERLQQRRSSEILYYVGPDEPTELIDEAMYRRVRCQEELTWAEDRLMQFGFETVIEGNIKSYIISSETFTVYADLRAFGEILFNVYMKSSPNRTPRYEGGFRFKDKWKNEICQKFQLRLLKATKQPDDPYFAGFIS
jgi:hypothetical protein